MINSAAIRNLFAAPFLIWAVLFIFCPVVAIAWYGLTDAHGAFTLANISLIAHWEYLRPWNCPSSWPSSVRSSAWSWLIRSALS